MGWRTEKGDKPDFHLSYNRRESSLSSKEWRGRKWPGGGKIQLEKRGGLNASCAKLIDPDPRRCSFTTELERRGIKTGGEEGGTSCSIGGGEMYSAFVLIFTTRKQK